MTRTPRTSGDGQVRTRLEACAEEWQVEIGQTLETESSLIAYGRRADRAVVLKVVRRPGDEWRSGEVVRAFDGRGMVRALEHRDGAVLLERLDPGAPLTEIVSGGRDEHATSVLADVMDAMHPAAPPAWCPTVHDWARGFSNYRASGDTQVPADLVTHAEVIYLDLCATQREPRLLHGDLQHYNVLYDRDRGWVTIDPKGVIGEREFELGAFIRNPAEQPAFFTDISVVRSRLERITGALGLDLHRATAWSYAQAVLSAVWGIEDGHRVEPSSPILVLARTIRRLVD